MTVVDVETAVVPCEHLGGGRPGAGRVPRRRGQGQQVELAAIGALDAGEAVLEIAAIQELIDHILDNGLARTIDF